jgi:hypothetical protein
VPSETVSLQDLGLDELPKTNSGKVQKAKLKKVVAEYLHSRDGSSRDASLSDEAAEKSESRLDDLHRIWSNLLSLSKERLTTSTPLVELADSITIMRSVHRIKRELGLTMTIREVMDNPTIGGQARLLQNRCQDSSSAATEEVIRTREGPPIATDMVHTCGSTERAQQTKTAFEDVSTGMDLTWEDVEDVVPISDFLPVMLRRLRAQSWNHRHAWKSTASPEKVRSALKQALAHNSMLRTMAAQPRDSAPLHYIIRPSDRWFKLVVTERKEAVATADELRTLCLNDQQLDFAAAPGPLFRAIIVPIQEGGTGLVYQAQHSCFDGLSMPNLGEDLKAILTQGENAIIQPRTPYKLFADTLFLHRDSVQAQIDTDFHVQRLKGLYKLDKSLWPLQRVPE